MKSFFCQDISLASYLKACGGTIINLVREDDHYLFEFAEQNQCEQLANQYWNKQAVGNIKEYEEAKQTLISMVKNKR
jgi:hypothetical protein